MYDEEGNMACFGLKSLHLGPETYNLSVETWFHLWVVTLGIAISQNVFSIVTNEFKVRLKGIISNVLLDSNINSFDFGKMSRSRDHTKSIFANISRIDMLIMPK